MAKTLPKPGSGKGSTGSVGGKATGVKGPVMKPKGGPQNSGVKVTVTPTKSPFGKWVPPGKPKR
jgi:hypothetical protein